MIFIKKKFTIEIKYLKICNYYPKICTFIAYTLILYLFLK